MAQLLGAHMSIAGGVYNAFVHGENTGCNTIQVFTKSSNQWRARPLSQEEITEFFKLQQKTKINPVVAHSSYLINIASPDKVLNQKSREALLLEVQRCETLKIPYLVLHPGSHLGAGEEEGIEAIARALDWLHQQTARFKTKICLETTAGQGQQLGFKFEQIKKMIDRVEEPKRLAVCLDTCHIFVAGYDIRSKKGYEATLAAFDQIIGLGYLTVIHFNDSKKEFGSRVDRHEHIGMGYLGKEPFGFFLNDKRLATIPKILETPKEADGYKEDKKNLAVLRSLIE